MYFCVSLRVSCIFLLFLLCFVECCFISARQEIGMENISKITFLLCPMTETLTQSVNQSMLKVRDRDSCSQAYDEQCFSVSIVVAQ